MSSRLPSSVDRVLALAGLLVTAPVMAAAAVAVWFESGGPILFKQARVGVRGRHFEILKFRSMRANSSGASITSGEDSRITRVGQVLRRYKLDELPQLWNVVRGDMSLIGPRPEVPKFVDQSDPRWQAVLRVRPGISDFATLIYRDEELLLIGKKDPEEFYRNEVLPHKLRLNMFYLERRSVVNDVKLLWLTLRYSLDPSGFHPDRIKQSLSFRGE
jgi:lipopolysaccharide/colanic/teichoic acid biosynthesis glycosyltransferase